jgi:hypothetical protein
MGAVSVAGNEMAKKKIRIDYTVYPPNHRPGDICLDFRTLRRAMSAARGFGNGALVFRNFNQEYKRGKAFGEWWTGRYFWTWNGFSFVRTIDPHAQYSGTK